MYEMQKKILIIDDDPDILEFLSYNLKNEGYQVAQALSGMNALWQLAEKCQPDLILLDLMLPGTHGFEICQYFKQSQEFKNIPIIILSAKGSAEDMETGLAMGANAYFVKASFTIQSLMGFIRKLLAKPIVATNTHFMKELTFT
jgi:DNA-binding response OmpR family regulator